MRHLFILLSITALGTGQVQAEKKYGPGVTDTEIKIGQTMPYSGPASSFSLLGKAEAAYFAKVNDEGGINGRKIKLISLDDGYSPPRTVEQTRRLVEQEEVLLIFGSVGSAGASAVHKFMNAMKVPHLFLATVAAKWDDPKHYPWTLAYPPAPKVDAHLYARYLLKHYPHARIGILYQNDDYGRDYLKALRDGLGEKQAAMIVAEVSYEASDPTIDSQLVTLKSGGADTLFTFANPKAAAQAIRKVGDMSWKPLYFINYSVASVETVLKPAGLDKSIGIISAQYTKDPSDPQWNDDIETKRYFAWMKKYYPEGDRADLYNVSGYNYAHAIVHVVEQCGDELTRENVMKQATSLNSLELPMLLPGIALSTSPADYAPIKRIYLRRFDGKRWAALEE
jgi:ABC-type branched-subunit amino acid transport system substrate-binding protein